MALPPLVRQLAEAKLTKYCERKIPAQIRDELKLDYKFRGNTVTLFESRPFYKDPQKRTDTVVAQFRYDPEDRTWMLYYADRNSRWQLYVDSDPSPNLDDLLAEVDEDPTGIFWG